MARPELNIAVAGTKNTASDYNENFDLMLDYIDDETQAAKDYVDSYMPSQTGQAGKILTTDGTDASWMSITGIIQYFGGSNPPSGWLTCDGSAVSRTTYANLFSVIGTNFGEGDGVNTFNLPDLIDRFPQGNTTVGTKKSAGLPNIKAWNITRRNSTVSNNGALSDTSSPAQPQYSGGSNTYLKTANFNAHTYNSIYSDSVTTVQPPALTLLPIIKY